MTAPIKKPKLRGRDKKRYCPICGTKTALPIQYGYPTKLAFDRANRGEVILGGCDLDINNPQWMCTTCDHTWRTIGESKFWSEYRADDLPDNEDTGDNTPP